MTDTVVTNGALIEILFVLGAAVLASAALHRLSVGPLLGYFVAGFVIGPNALALVADAEPMRVIGEFGVVFLLFAIGLELPLKRLWVMRRWLVGLGFVQVALTSAAIAAMGLAFGHDAPAAIVIGGALALSSTAVALHVLVERGELATRFGRAAFSILLVQDLAVVPLLVLLPHLGRAEAPIAQALGLAALEAAGALAVLAIVARFALRPVLRAVAGTRSAELFSAATLLLVLGSAVATASVGLSTALGGFLAGMLLAESEYRHQVEADIRPFRGLLLGLFFMTVGMAIDPDAIVDEAPAILSIVAALAVAKGAIVAALARLFGLSPVEAVRTGLVLAHGGEFAFVILTLAASVGVLEIHATHVLVVATALSMALCPTLDAAGRRWAARRAEATGVELDALADEFAGLSAHVIVAGYGRVGQVVGRLLAARGIPWAALETDARRVAEARRRGEPVHYGDATRTDVLRAAGADRARAAAITLDRAEQTVLAVRAVRRSWPRLTIATRARDHAHASELTAEGASAAVPETMEASLSLGAHILDAFGTDPETTRSLIDGLRAEGAERRPN